ncbi:putative Glucoamylase [Akanthomyces lecanii RCEF 1005]|uniref:Putative Glucoamylase n=1 Tax=Akanthomyces lecanii RCEF 1005 TaxID=1081108 RepID=A0A168J9A6_CORDF|nr:putative Glucoamylase [Akanthomyces lecanii RCEF 1005]
MHHSMKMLLAAFAALPFVTSRATAGTIDGKPIVETTNLSNGHVLDWVMQDEVAPPSDKPDLLKGLFTPLNGPKGAVPYLRQSTPSNGVEKKSPSQGTAKRATIPDGHKYALTGQSVANLGGGATFSLYDPYLESTSDMSLIQTAISSNFVQNSYFGKIQQTVEAGWQKYPLLNPPTAHFFCFYTATGYHSVGDYQGGYNREVAGWTQVDTDIYPGHEFRPFSVDGGAQNDINLEYHLTDGKWWLSVGGRDIGYYPASLFTQNVTSSTSLATGADKITFYGEMYSDKSQTTSDMGSGEFPSAGKNKAAYIRNMVYTSANDGTTYNYEANLQDIITDPYSYNLEAHYNAGAPWNSYMLVGGPGYGGNIGS